MESPHRIPEIVSAGALVLLLLSPLAAEEPPAPFVVLDYLPTFVYHDEDARIHVRIPGDDPGRLGVELVLKAKAEEKGTIIMTCRSSTPSPEFQFVISGSTLARSSSLIFERGGGKGTPSGPVDAAGAATSGREAEKEAASAVRTGGSPSGAGDGRNTKVLELAVVKAWKKLPPLRAAGGWFETTENKKAIVVVKHVHDESRRKWVLVRKMAEWVKRRQPPQKVVLLTDLAADQPKSKKSSLMVCPTADLNASHCALAKLSWETSVKKDTSFLVVLGTSDIRAGIDPVAYRRNLEAIIQQLQVLGVERIRLATPVAAPFHAGRLEKYEKVVENASWRFRLESPVSSSRYLSRGAWLADPYTGTARARLSKEATQVLILGLLGAWR